MSRVEYQVTYRREGNRQVKRRIFGQKPALDRFLDNLHAETERKSLLPVEGLYIARREVGLWERIWETGVRL